MERLHSEQDVRKSVIVCEGVLPLPDATYLLPHLQRPPRILLQDTSRCEANPVNLTHLMHPKLDLSQTLEQVGQSFKA